MSAPGGGGDPIAPEPLDWGDGGGEEQPLAQIAFLMDPWGVLKRRWPWMLCVSIVGVAASVAAYVLWTPVFVAHARLLITSQQIPRDFVRSTVEENTIQNINAMVGEILSIEKLGRILDQFDPFPELTDTNTRLALVGRLRSDIEIAPESGGGGSSIIYRVTVENKDPAKSAEIANALAALFIDSSTRRRNEQARQATLFLGRELERDEAELREQSRRVAEFRREHRGELPDELDVNLRKLEFLSERRRETLALIAELETRIDDIRSGAGVERSRNEILLEELRRQLADELAIHTDEHPNVTALERRLELLEEEVAGERLGGGEKRELSVELTRRLEREERELDRLRAGLREIETETQDISRRVDLTPVVAEQLNALVHKEDVLREGYLASLRKVEDAERAESLEASHHASQVTVLDSARPPGTPQIEAWLVLAGGIAGSFALALGVALLLEIIDPVIVSAAQLDHVAQRPVLGSIPRFE